MLVKILRKDQNKYLFRTIQIALILFVFLACTKEKKQEVAKVEDKVKVSTEPFFKISLAQWSLHKAFFDKSIAPMDFAKKAKEVGIAAVE